MSERSGLRSSRAVALRYLTGMPAPFIIAKADGRGAQRLVALAKEAGIAIVREDGLAEALYPLKLGELVPEELYEIVAKVFVFIKSLEKGSTAL